MPWGTCEQVVTAGARWFFPVDLPQSGRGVFQEEAAKESIEPGALYPAPSRSAAPPSSPSLGFGLRSLASCPPSGSVSPFRPLLRKQGDGKMSQLLVLSCLHGSASSVPGARLGCRRAPLDVLLSLSVRAARWLHRPGLGWLRGSAFPPCRNPSVSGGTHRKERREKERSPPRHKGGRQPGVVPG